VLNDYFPIRLQDRTQAIRKNTRIMRQGGGAAPAARGDWIEGVNMAGGEAILDDRASRGREAGRLATPMAASTILYYVAASVVILYCLWTIDTVSGTPSPGLKVDFEGRVWYVAPGGPAHRAGLQAGDRILSVEGVPVAHPYEALPVLSGMRAGDDLHLEVRRRDRDLAATLSLQAHPVSLLPLASLAGFLALLIQGIFLYRQSARTVPFRLYLWLIPTAMLWSTMRLMLDHIYFTPPAASALMAWGTHLSFLFVPLVTHFAYAFTGRRPLVSLGPGAILPVIYLPVAVYLLYDTALTALLLARLASGAPEAFYSLVMRTSEASNALTVCVAIYNGLLVLFSLFLLSSALVRSESSELRSQIRMIFIGVLLILVPAVLIVILSLFGDVARNNTLRILVHDIYSLTLSMGMLGTLFMTSLALIRFHLGQADVLFHKTLIYGLLFGLFFVLFLVLLCMASTHLVQATERGSQLMFLASALILAMVFQPLREGFHRLLKRILPEEAEGFQKVLDQVSSEGFSAADPDRLLQEFLDLLVRDAGVQKAAAFHARPGEEGELVPSARRGVSSEEAEALCRDIPGAALAPLQALGAPLSRYGLQQMEAWSGNRDRLLALLAERGLEVMVPLGYRSNSHGLLLLGGKRSRNLYSAKELGLLAQAARHCSGFLHGVQLKQQVRTLTGQLESLQEDMSTQSEIIRVQKQEIQSLTRALETGKNGSKCKTGPLLPPVELVGTSPPFQKLLREVRDVAGTGAPVLILGETGTGKDLVAQAIHQASHRKGGAFVSLNCSAIPEGLIESELFGHEKGAFTGATEQRLGKFETAHGGTLFLNEIGEMHLHMQAKLLRAIEHEEFERVGGTRTISVDVHIIAATNRNLEEAVRQGTFREDLYYRLKVVPIRMPPLRARKEDIPLLARHFLKKYAGKLNKEVPDLEEEALARLQRHGWPGNVRELENLMERAVVLYKSGNLELPALRASNAGPEEEAPPDLNIQEAVKEYKKRLVLAALRRTGWNKAQAARLLGIQYPNIFRLINQMGIREDGER